MHLTRLSHLRFKISKIQNFKMIFKQILAYIFLFSIVNKNKHLTVRHPVERISRNTFFSRFQKIVLSEDPQYSTFKCTLTHLKMTLSLRSEMGFGICTPLYSFRSYTWRFRYYTRRFRSYKGRFRSYKGRFRSYKGRFRSFTTRYTRS